MKDLLKWQFVSFISRGVAMALGIIQSIVIVRILTVSEYGLINIVVSVGSAFGVYQHLGLASGSTREISAADDDTEIFKIFLTSFFIRYLITVPLAIGLFFFSEYIALTQYGNVDMVFPLRLFSVILLIQGVQSIFNSVISGTQRFKTLFVYQMAIAVVSLFIYIPLIFLYKVNGYFYALILFNIIGSISLGFLALKPLKTKFALPHKEDFTRLLKEILSISLGIYAVKIIYTYWQKSGPLLLGLQVSPEDVGIFSFALLYGAKLMAVSDAVTDVNLPVLSKKFSSDLGDFKALFKANFDKVYVFLLFAAASAVYWSREVFWVFVGSDKYDASLSLVFPMVFAFIFYAVVNIIKSSIIIPAKLVKEMIFSFLIMLIGTVSFYFLMSASLGALPAMAYGMGVGALLGLLAMMVISKLTLDFIFLEWKHVLLFLSALGISFVTLPFLSLIKFGAYFVMIFMYFLFVMFLGFLTKENFTNLFRMVKRGN